MVRHLKTFIHTFTSHVSHSEIHLEVPPEFQLPKPTDCDILLCSHYDIFICSSVGGVGVNEWKVGMYFLRNK
jgi:hypothetical protein